MLASGSYRYWWWCVLLVVLCLLLGWPAGQVDGGVHIPVQDEAADRAAVGPVGQRQIRFELPAARAGFRRRIPPVGNSQSAAVPGGLVGQQPSQVPKTGIGQCPGK